MNNCTGVGENGNLECKNFFVNQLHMYDFITDVSDINCLFIVVIFIIPLLPIALYFSIDFLMVLIYMNPHGCFHRDFGINYVTLVIVSIIFDGVFGCLLVRVLPWFDVFAVDLAVSSHMACKFMAFLSSFLSAARANLLVAHCVLHIFAIELHVERKNITPTIIILNVVCLIGGALMAIFASTVNGVWVIANQLVCLPDPEWNQPTVVFYMINKGFFCDGLVQALVILAACIHLRRLRKRLSGMADCLIFITDSKFLLFYSLKHFRDKLVRNMECLRVVYCHAAVIALIRIGRSIHGFMVTYNLYGGNRMTLFTSDAVPGLVHCMIVGDLIILVEMVGELMHAWIAYYWQSTIRNQRLDMCIACCRCFCHKKMQRDLHDLYYLRWHTSSRGDSQRERRSLLFDRNFLKYARLIAARLTEKNLHSTLSWLPHVPNLPMELEEFLGEIHLTKRRKIKHS